MNLKLIISLIIRTTQFIFSVVGLGLAAQAIKLWGAYDRINLNAATAVLSIIYLILTVIPQVISALSTAYFATIDAILAILWLASFASMADLWAMVDCGTSITSYYGIYYDIFTNFTDTCTLAKALIGIGVVAFVLFLASFITILWFARTLPRDHQSSAGNVILGGVFVNYIPTTDVEADIAAEGNKEVLATADADADLDPDPELSPAPEAGALSDEPSTEVKEVSPVSAPEPAPESPIAPESPPAPESAPANK